jgi:hypothetical protein
MEKLNFPHYEFRISRSQDNKVFIFDPLRKKNVALTPEEWVRQNIIRVLVDDRNFPPSLIVVEAGLKVNRNVRRYDLLVYNREGQPLMLIECKAPVVSISQNTFDQVAAYNLTVKAKFLLVTNGIKHFMACFDPQSKSFNFLDDIPFFDKI